MNCCWESKGQLSGCAGRVEQGGMNWNMVLRLYKVWWVLVGDANKCIN